MRKYVYQCWLPHSGGHARMYFAVSFPEENKFNNYIRNFHRRCQIFFIGISVIKCNICGNVN